jgi:hypothetical protein
LALLQRDPNENKPWNPLGSDYDAFHLARRQAEEELKEKEEWERRLVLVSCPLIK